MENKFNLKDRVYYYDDSFQEVKSFIVGKIYLGINDTIIYVEKHSPHKERCESRLYLSPTPLRIEHYTKEIKRNKSKINYLLDEIKKCNGFLKSLEKELKWQDLK